MTCAHCAALARENADLRDEVAAWRAYDAGDLGAGRAAEREKRWATGLGLYPVAARLVLTLADTPDRAFSYDRLGPTEELRARTSPQDCVAVYVYWARRSIRRLGLEPGIENVRGYGYLMTRSAAARLKAAMGDVSGRSADA